LPHNERITAQTELSNWYEVLKAESYTTTERTWKEELGTKLINWIKIDEYKTKEFLNPVKRMYEERSDEIFYQYTLKGKRKIGRAH
jgi:hypothetical protein